MTSGRISALAVGLALGLVTAAEAEDWTGPYVTLGFSAAATNLGEAEVGDNPFLAVDETAERTYAPYVAAGYDWAFDGFTLGVVGDLDFGSIDNGDALSQGKGFYGDSDWFATLRARAGMPVADGAQVYVSGGAAWMRVGATGVQSSFPVPGPDTAVDGGSRTLTGTAYGLGSEFALKNGHHLTVEVLRAEFDRSDAFLSGSSVAGTLAPDITAFRIGYTLRF